MKKQLVYIHGGEPWDTYEDYLNYLQESEVDPFKELALRWNKKLKEDLQDRFEVFTPSMPSKYNCKYVEWKIWFEKYIPFLRDDVFLLGYSQGALFLYKYLSENVLPVSIQKIIFVAGPHGAHKDGDYGVADFEIVEDLSDISEQCNQITIYHSEDDFVVPVEDAYKYKKLLPVAQLVVFKDRNHFLQEEFPELIENIKNS